MRLDQIAQLQVEPTTYCNAKCPQCPRFQWKTGNLREDLTLMHWDVDTIFPNMQLDEMVNLEYVLIEGDKGDPLMHPQIYEIVMFFLNAPSNPVVRLVTNGSIRTPDWWSKLGQSANDRLEVMFSIDGLEDTNHLYRVGVDYTQVINNASAFINSGGNAMWKCIVFKHNETQLNDIKKTAKDLGFAKINYRRCSDRFTNRTDPFPVKVNGAVSHTLEPTTLTKETIRSLNETFVERYPAISLAERVDTLCPRMSAGWLYVDVNGCVLPCCLTHNVINETTPTSKFFRNKIIVDESTISLRENKFVEVLSRAPMFRNLEANITNNKQRYTTCHNNCLEQIEAKLELQQKSDKYTNVS